MVRGKGLTSLFVLSGLCNYPSTICWKDYPVGNESLSFCCFHTPLLSLVSSVRCAVSRLEIFYTYLLWVVECFWSLENVSWNLESFQPLFFLTFSCNFCGTLIVCILLYLMLWTRFHCSIHFSSVFFFLCSSDWITYFVFNFTDFLCNIDSPFRPYSEFFTVILFNSKISLWFFLMVYVFLVDICCSHCIYVYVKLFKA